MKNKIIVMITWILVLTTGITLGFNYFWTGNEQIMNINAEMSMIETQILGNKAERTMLENEKQDYIAEVNKKQAVFKNANNELRKQIKELNDEKKKLGL